MSQIYNPYPGQTGIVIPTTSTTTLCTPSYKSVTLAANETIILPPGATIISATNPGAIQSDCAKISLSPECCWAFRFDSIQSPDESIVGIYFDGTHTSYYFEPVTYSQFVPFITVDDIVDIINNTLRPRIQNSAGISAGGPVLDTAYNNNFLDGGFTEHTVWIKSLCEFGRPHLIVANPNNGGNFITTFDLVRATGQACSNFGASLGQDNMTLDALGL
jgi:hypothetical protein